MLCKMLLKASKQVLQRCKWCALCQKKNHIWWRQVKVWSQLATNHHISFVGTTTNQKEGHMQVFEGDVDCNIAYIPDIQHDGGRVKVSSQPSANHQRCKFHICHRFGNQSAQMHNPITADAYSIGYDANSIGYHKGCRWMFVRFAMQ